MPPEISDDSINQLRAGIPVQCADILHMTAADDGKSCRVLFALSRQELAIMQPIQVVFKVRLGNTCQFGQFINALWIAVAKQTEILADKVVFDELYIRVRAAVTRITDTQPAGAVHIVCVCAHALHLPFHFFSSVRDAT
jgi:hypothetical protein